MTRILRRTSVILSLLIASLDTAHAAQDPGNSIASKRAVAFPISDAIQVDGLLNEGAWRSATPIGEILQREPRQGDPATENTEVRLLFDEANLYIGVRTRNKSIVTGMRYGTCGLAV
jgi:hypothetical protein